MKNLIESFPEQLKEAIDIGEKATFTKPKHKIQNIVITGLGGSGIGGTIVQQLTQDKIEVPISVNKGYFLPNFVNEHTLLIVSSYSGNTEETLMAFDAGLKANAKIACVTSGGMVKAYAEQHDLDFIQIPGGNPPRACLGYSLTQLFYILKGYDLIDASFQKDLVEAVALIIDEKESIHKEAKDIANKLHNKIPIIYSADNFEGISIRFRQQVNENSKMLCWHHALPEMNHNELVGWKDKNDDIAVIFFRTDEDFVRTQRRMEISKEIISKYTSNIYEVHSKGNSTIERSIYLINLGDWISWYLSELHGVDATEVNVIDFLKGSLAKD
ncbi:MAG: bifunctional phosphoglucose/phosphomannose isomerase [Bacteroidia bacterium]|nr:bifunctional phosphoglucose/phosphomannose isomerase [Bacteroidia bacterium]